MPPSGGQEKPIGRKKTRPGKGKGKEGCHVLVKIDASFKGEEDAVELGVDGHPLPHLLVENGPDGAKVLLGSNVDLAMVVVHKDVAQLREAQKGQGPNVEATTLLSVDKCKQVIHVVGVPTLGRGTQRLATNKHSFKLDFKKVKELPKTTFKPPKGKVIRGPLALLVGIGKEVKVRHPISLTPKP